MRLTALRGAIHLAMDARAAAEAARRATPLQPEGMEQTADVDPVLLLRGLSRIADEIEDLGKHAKIA